MTIHKVKGGTYLSSWRVQELKGKAKIRAARPKRSLLAVQTALHSLSLRYCQEVSFWNPLYKGKQGDLTAGLQWVDFVVKPKGKRAFIVIVNDRHKRANAVDKLSYQTKLEGLTDRGTPLLIVKSGMTSQEYFIQIMWFLRKLERSML